MSDVSADSVSYAGQAEAGRWLSIQEAARHLSVSERTVYRRADRGQLQRRTHPDGRVDVWVPDAEMTDASDVSDDTVSQERAVLLVDRVSTAVTRQLEAMTVELAASRERIEALARENGALAERVAGLERELSGVRQMSDDDRQGLTDELETARAALQELRAGERVSQAEEIGRLTAELAAEREAKSSLLVSGGSETSGVPESAALSRWRAWEPRLLALVTLAIAVALLAWLW